MDLLDFDDVLEEAVLFQASGEVRLRLVAAADLVGQIKLLHLLEGRLLLRRSAVEVRVALRLH